MLSYVMYKPETKISGVKGSLINVSSITSFVVCKFFI